MEETKREHLHSGHRSRVKEQFAKSGMRDFQDHQVLEMLLFYAIPQRDTNELAHKLIRKFGSMNSARLQVFLTHRWSRLRR